MSSLGGTLCVFTLAVGGATALACSGVTEATRPLPPEPQPIVVISEIDASPELDEFTSQPVIQAGFTHCCGNDEYVMQIDCSDRLMRCYERRELGEWKQVFGRHCKQQLSEACYVDGCAPRCP